jgi:hypothetical protein
MFKSGQKEILSFHNFPHAHWVHSRRPTVRTVLYKPY